jgi:hypothetical protein
MTTVADGSGKKQPRTGLFGSFGLFGSSGSTK